MFATSSMHRLARCSETVIDDSRAPAPRHGIPNGPSELSSNGTKQTVVRTGLDGDYKFLKQFPWVSDPV